MKKEILLDEEKEMKVKQLYEDIAKIKKIRNDKLESAGILFIVTMILAAFVSAVLIQWLGYLPGTLPRVILSDAIAGLIVATVVSSYPLGVALLAHISIISIEKTLVILLDSIINN